MKSLLTLMLSIAALECAADGPLSGALNFAADTVQNTGAFVGDTVAGAAALTDDSARGLANFVRGNPGNPGTTTYYATYQGVPNRQVYLTIDDDRNIRIYDRLPITEVSSHVYLLGTDSEGRVRNVADVTNAARRR